MKYPRVVPVIIPPGRVLVHNHVAHAPDTRQGVNGFRFWLRGPGDELEPCPCGWAPQLLTHYRVRRATG